MVIRTVGDLKRLLNTLPDYAPIRPVWLDPSVIADACPAVTLCGFERRSGSPLPGCGNSDEKQGDYLAVKGDLTYPDAEPEFDGDDDDNS